MWFMHPMPHLQNYQTYALTDEGGEFAPVDIGQQPIVSSSHQASGAVSPSQIIKVLPTPNADNKERFHFLQAIPEAI